jgi:hypothetical protein
LQGTQGSIEAKHIVTLGDPAQLELERPSRSQLGERTRFAGTINVRHDPVVAKDNDGGLP